MSIEFSQELDAAPIITPALTGLDLSLIHILFLICMTKAQEV